jgi:hypothetical protein
VAWQQIGDVARDVAERVEPRVVKLTVRYRRQEPRVLKIPITVIEQEPLVLQIEVESAS